jgi:hypothetical protein
MVSPPAKRHNLQALLTLDDVNGTDSINQPWRVNMAVINLRDFPDDLHQAAKIKAVMEKTTLREIVIRAISEYVKKPEVRSRKKGG